MKVVFATPSLSGPMAPFIKALEDSDLLVKAAGFETGWVQEIGCPYISHARATMTRKALDAGADVVVYLDYDLSWDPKDLLTLINTEGDVVAGTYRFKKDEETYMGAVHTDGLGRASYRESDKAVRGFTAPAGFLKVTREAIRTIMRAYPELVYGNAETPCVDLFNHGAYNGTWYGEDIAFSRRWLDCGKDLWIVPNLNITHHTKDKAYPGNFHKYLGGQ